MDVAIHYSIDPAAGPPTPAPSFRPSSNPSLFVSPSTSTSSQPSQGPSTSLKPSISIHPSAMPSTSIAPSESPSIAKLFAQLGSDLDGEFGGDDSGSAVALSFYGDTVAIGARYNDGGGYRSGHVRVFSWDGLAWSQKGPDLDGAASYDYLGSSVALSADGDIVAAGAPGNDGGHVRVWKWVDDHWSQLGDDILGETSSDQSGLAISLSADGTVLAVGARYNDDNGTRSGHSYSRDRDGYVRLHRQRPQQRTRLKRENPKGKK